MTAKIRKPESRVKILTCIQQPDLTDAMPLLVLEIQQATAKQSHAQLNSGSIFKQCKYQVIILACGLPMFFTSCNSTPSQPAAPPSLNADASADKKADDKNTKNLKGSFSSDKAGSLLLSYWKPQGVVSAEHTKILNQWLNKNQPGVDIATFINSGKYAIQREKAVNDLHLK